MRIHTFPNPFKQPNHKRTHIILSTQEIKVYILILVFLLYLISINIHLNQPLNLKTYGKP